MSKKANKYGGINDVKNCDKKTYNLWKDMLRRCNDKEFQQKSGRTYVGCKVCEEWYILSNFVRDIKTLENYELWRANKRYSIDKDIKIPGNKLYSKETCIFTTVADNSRDAMKRNPQAIKIATEYHKMPITLSKNGKTLRFNSQKEACDFLGARPDAIATCIYHKCRCRGYEIARV